MGNEVMTLSRALMVVADGLTRDDNWACFTVSYSRDKFGRFTDSEYVEAMKTIRQYVGLPVEPSPSE